MQKIRIDFDNPGLPQHISAVENDSQSRFFQATLYENGKAYTAPEGAAYSIMYHGFGPQNQGWYDTINDGAGKRAACNVSGNVVTCEIARQALQVPGHVSIVLCVTTGKGYMLKSWPIECDCKNDRYDSTVEIESFFYITQVSNADWTQAIQAWENLKDAIDSTLSLSGKAADAAKVGEAVNAESERAKGVESQIKEDLVDTSGTVEYKLDGSIIFVDREIYNAEIHNHTAVVYLQNRFDYTTIPLYANSYNSLHTITHQDNGLKIIRKKMEESAVTAVVSNYTAEFTGNLWFSCNAKGENAEDIAVNVKNTRNNDAERLYGIGRLYCMLKVSAGDVIEIRFYTCLNNITSANTIVYSNIMLQYGVLTDFVEYKTTLKTVSLPKDVSAYASSTAANGKYRITIPFKNIAPDYDKSILPMNNDTVAKITISGMELKTYNETFNNANGIGLSSQGTLSIYQNGGGRDEFAYWLRTNDINISYKSASSVEFSRHLYPSMIAVSDRVANIIGFSKPSTKIKSTIVCMGDSITGMFGHETGYPEMISKKYPEIKAINVGFSGTSVIDHADKNYMPFSFNRLVDAIISGDWSEQDAKVGNISTANYAEHLTTLKDIDFANVDFITVFYGTNDWGYNYSIDTFKEVYSKTLKKLQAKYPQIRIVVICPYWRSISNREDSNINPNNNGIYLYDFSNAIENDVAFTYNLPCINLYRSLGANSITNRYYTQDGTHPTFRTRNIIADKIVKTIL